MLSLLEIAAFLLPTLINGQIYVPQAALDAQSSMNAEFAAYLSYRPTATAAAPTASAKPKTNVNVAAASAPYWLENVKHQGIAAFNSNPSGYQVFRNVKAYGARGDGQTDDTDAINRAMSDGGRCGPFNCQSSTRTPAVVYFPGGTYIVNSTIVDYYYTQIIGNPNDMPVLKATADFRQGGGKMSIIDGDPYDPSYHYLLVGATNIFWRQIRNLIIDMTAVPASSDLAAIHWPTGQATSLQNIVFRMTPSSKHVGVYIEQGSGGFMNDLVFTGGDIGLNIGNQQFTMRNLTFSGVRTAINQGWNWGSTYQNINIDNCQTGINMRSNGVGSMTILDSSISNTPLGINTGRSTTTANSPPNADSLVLEKIKLTNVKTALAGPYSTFVGNVPFIPGFLQGTAYTPKGPTTQSTFTAGNTRPGSLLGPDGKYYQRSKPQYEGLPASSFLSARDQGARGDGKTDDTAALQNAINNAKAQGKVLFLDHGDYLVSKPIYIPAGSRIVGETFPVILSYGQFFDNMSSPQPVVQIGRSGEAGSVELSDFIVSTRGTQRGAILIQYNLAAPVGTPSGLWDVHVRIGGFAGSSLLVGDCKKTPDVAVPPGDINTNCISGFLSLHITKNSTSLYLENVWLWVADHDIEDPGLTQITVYAGRGLLDESINGPVWLVGTSVEHHQRYEYQFANTKNVYQGQIQTETAYYQPNPIANVPFPYNAAYNDLYFPGPNTVTDNGVVIPNSNGVGLRIVNSQNILTYGAGHYSFFNNYNVTCSQQGENARCQSKTTIIDGNNSGISIYNLNTVGTHWPITINGTNIAYWADNQNGFIQTINSFRV